MENKIYDVAEVSSANMLAVRIRTTIRNTQKIMLDSAISIGQDLMQAQKLVADGEWQEWVEQATGMTCSSARKYMQIAREYGDESKRELIPALSYTKALRLLAVPEEEREEIAENNDIENMTVKELEEVIKALKDEKTAVDQDKTKLEEDLRAAQEKIESIGQREQELAGQLDALKENAPEGISEEAQAEIDKIRMEKLEEIQKMAKEKETVEGKVEKLKGQLDKLKQDQEKLITEEREKAIAEGKEEGKKESEAEIQKLMEITERANEAKQDAEKKLAAASDGEVSQLGFLANQIGTFISDAARLLNVIESKDPEKAGKIRIGLKGTFGKMIEEM